MWIKQMSSQQLHSRQQSKQNIISFLMLFVNTAICKQLHSALGKIVFYLFNLLIIKNLYKNICSFRANNLTFASVIRIQQARRRANVNRILFRRPVCSNKLYFQHFLLKHLLAAKTIFVTYHSHEKHHQVTRFSIRFKFICCSGFRHRKESWYR